MNKEKLVSDFYKSDGINFASYDNLRKLPHYVDGLKISQRKLLYTGFSKANKDYHRTEPFCNISATEQAYIHGPQNLIGIVSLMAAQYVGSNNYSFFVGNDSGFGSRINPSYASGRYTKIKLSDISKVLFNKTDLEISEKQFFEGQYIEPRFFVPIFPTVFLNSSEGLSTGFASAVFPRNPVEIIEYIKKKISGTEHPRTSLLPWFRGHTGKVEYNAELGKNECFGVITRNNMNSYTISELPIGISYQKYVELLDRLCENGTIQDYDDRCDPKTDTILFDVKTSRDFTRKHEGRRLYEVFQLVKNLPETLCCIDENNRVREFSSIQEILDAFIELRLKFYEKRKAYILKSLRADLERLVAKYVFCDGVIKGNIKVANVKKDVIIEQLEKIEKIIKIDGSYGYVLNMPMHSVSKDTMDELKTQISELKNQFKSVKETSIQEMWTNDLHELKKLL